MKPPKKAVHQHKGHRPHRAHKPHKRAPAKKQPAAKHPAHKPHPGSPAAPKGRAKAAPGSVCGAAYVPVSSSGLVFAAEPVFVDLSAGLPGAWFQGDEDSCVEHAVDALYAYAGGDDLGPLWDLDGDPIPASAATCAAVLGLEAVCVRDLQACLSDGLPVAFGCTLFESFADEPAVLGMPADDEPILGPHAMVAVGIGFGREWPEFPEADPATRYVKVRNSWGTDAHHDGHLLMPTAYLIRYAADFWTIRSAT